MLIERAYFFVYWAAKDIFNSHGKEANGVGESSAAPSQEEQRNTKVKVAKKL